MLYVKTSSNVSGYVYAGYLSVVETSLDSGGNTVNLCKPYDAVKDKELIRFGSFKGTDLLWHVISEGEDGSLLLVSHYLIITAPYNSRQGYNTTWENSSLRSWLNADFLKNAFSAEDRERLLNPGNGCLESDLVSLMSIGNVRNSAFMFGEGIYSPCWLIDKYAASSDRAYYMENGGFDESYHETVTNSLGVRPVIRISE